MKLLSTGLRHLSPGIIHFTLHPRQDTPELRAIYGDWTPQVANGQAVLDPGTRRDVQNTGTRIVGYFPLRDLLRRRLKTGEVKSQRFRRFPRTSWPSSLNTSLGTRQRSATMKPGPVSLQTKYCHFTEKQASSQADPASLIPRLKPGP